MIDQIKLFAQIEKVSNLKREKWKNPISLSTIRNLCNKCWRWVGKQRLHPIL